MSLVFDDRNVTSFHLPISLFEILRSLTSSILILEIIFNVQFSRYHITCFASYFEKSLRDSRYFYRNTSPLSIFLNRNSFISIPWRQRDSNSRPPACKAGALPTELHPHRSGIHLLSHTVSSAVPSAAQVLTVVFGMGTGVSPARIDAGNLLPLR